MGSTSAAAAAALSSAVLKFSEEKCLLRGIKRKEEKSSRSISEYLRCCLASLLSVTIKGIAVRNIKRGRGLLARAKALSLPAYLMSKSRQQREKEIQACKASEKGFSLLACRQKKKVRVSVFLKRSLPRAVPLKYEL